MNSNLEADDFKKRIDNLEQQISDERARLSTDRMDISFGELINMYKVGELVNTRGFSDGKVLRRRL